MVGIATFLQATVTKLELICRGDVISTATGFYLRVDSEWYLVSNWHVFTGRSRFTGQAIHSSGAVPDQVRCYSLSQMPDEKFLTLECVLSLGDVWQQTSTWFQHPELGQDVDVAVLPIGREIPGLAKDMWAESRHHAFIDSGDEVFLPGYPLGLTGPGMLPIWKRASVATTLHFGEGVKHKILVDTASREGMSGSPCIARFPLSYWSFDDSTRKFSLVNEPFNYRLIGVYSGRINAGDSLGAQLGEVWRENRIIECVRGRQPGRVDLRSG